MKRRRRVSYRTRRLVVSLSVAMLSLLAMFLSTDQQQIGVTLPGLVDAQPQVAQQLQSTAVSKLEELAIKGRAPKTGYKRSQFGAGWQYGRDNCSMRNAILQRDLKDAITDSDCKVKSGKLDDPYTGKSLYFARGPESSNKVQIDHVVALSNAWQTGAQQLSMSQRVALANDPLNLLAVDGKANQEKGDGDAATWLPSNKAYRCAYVARQIAVKHRYGLWVTPPEKSAMQRILSACPQQMLPQP